MTSIDGCRSVYRINYSYFCSNYTGKTGRGVTCIGCEVKESKALGILEAETRLNFKQILSSKIQDIPTRVQA